MGVMQVVSVVALVSPEILESGHQQRLEKRDTLKFVCSFRSLMHRRWEIGASNCQLSPSPDQRTIQLSTVRTTVWRVRESS